MAFRKFTISLLKPEAAITVLNHDGFIAINRLLFVSGSFAIMGGSFINLRLTLNDLNNRRHNFTTSREHQRKHTVRKRLSAILDCILYKSHYCLVIVKINHQQNNRKINNNNQQQQQQTETTRAVYHTNPSRHP